MASEQLTQSFSVADVASILSRIGYPIVLVRTPSGDHLANRAALRLSLAPEDLAAQVHRAGRRGSKEVIVSGVRLLVSDVSLAGALWYAGTAPPRVGSWQIHAVMKRTDLSPRQRQVAALLYERCPTKLIAKRLGISHATARRHVEAVYRRMGVHSRGTLIRSLDELRCASLEIAG